MNGEDDEVVGAGCRRCGQPTDGHVHCPNCAKTASQEARTRLLWRQRMLAENPSIRPHGDILTYQAWGCRCADCRYASMVERRRYVLRGQVRTQFRSAPFGREWIGAAGT